MYRDILILKQLLLYNIVSKNINPYQTHLFHHLSRIFAKVRFFFRYKDIFFWCSFYGNPYDTGFWFPLNHRDPWVNLWQFGDFQKRALIEDGLGKFHAEPAEFAESSHAIGGLRILVLRRFAFHKILRFPKHSLRLMTNPNQNHDGFNGSKSCHGHGQWSWSTNPCCSGRWLFFMTRDFGTRDVGRTSTMRKSFFVLRLIVLRPPSSQ